MIKEGQLAQYTLKLSFDLRQVTQSLAYEFVLGYDGQGNDDNSYPMEHDGPLAGTFNFQQGDEIYVEVIATIPGNMEAETFLDDFAVTNCTLVSVPARMTEFLSLFNEKSACATVLDWGKVKPVPPRTGDNQRRFSTLSTVALPVVTKNGQWQISGYLSVQLPPRGDVPILDGTRNQLYFFDPEGSSGVGGFGP